MRRSPPGSEGRLLAWLEERLGPGHLLGDDAAVLPAAGRRAVTVDSQIAGVHFPADLDPRLLARRLLEVNLSDLAAMGARPAHAFLALQAERGFDHRRFLDAFVAACRRRGVTLAGGDLATSPVTAASLTVTGEAPAAGDFLTRGGARPGDTLWVGGSLGESAAGRLVLARGGRVEGGRAEPPDELPPELAEPARRAIVRHLLPRAQLDLAARLAAAGATAAIDLSDGLSLDLARLAAASGVGARVAAHHLPLPPAFPELAAWLGADPLELALGGGEDYVLLFTLPASLDPDRRDLTPEAHRIGEIVEGPELLLDRDGTLEPLPALGWDHLDPDP